MDTHCCQHWSGAPLCHPHHPAPDLSSSCQLQCSAHGFPQPPLLHRWAHHQQTCSILLRPNQGYCKLPRSPPVLLGQASSSGDHWSAQSSTFSLPPSPSPSLAHPGERLFLRGPKFERSSATPSPPHRHRTAGFSWPWAERLYGPAIPYRGGGPVQ
jgi:hypothetical protein